MTDRKRVRLSAALGCLVLALSFACSAPTATGGVPTVYVAPTLPQDTPPPTAGATQAPAPTATPTIGLGTIRGVLWHEICEFTGGQAGEPLVLGRGCVQWGDGAAEFGPNQLQDGFETGWEGVTIHLGAGACPSTGLDTAVTDGTGAYAFEGLIPGVYCVSYSNLGDGNDTILIPGAPTFPERGEGGFEREVDLSTGGHATGVDFGYAFQFYN